MVIRLPPPSTVHVVYELPLTYIGKNTHGNKLNRAAQKKINPLPSRVKSKNIVVFQYEFLYA